MLSASNWFGETLVPQTATTAPYEAQTAVSSSQNNLLTDEIDALLVDDGQNPKKLTKDYVFGLNSLPSSTYTIYLDFNGHVNSSGTLWQRYGYGKITTPAYSLDSDRTSFSNDELKSIYEIWLRVSEDFAPFNVNVTTKEPSADDLVKSDKNDAEYGVRVCIGGSYSDWYITRSGGISFVGSFTLSSDTPVYVFSDVMGSAKVVAETVSHEVGHSLGLKHDGNSTTDYYVGANGWAPIMGFSDYQTLTQWSKGEYANASNKEDDLKIITTKNGFGYRSDDFGNTTKTASTIAVDASGICANGIIERNTDVDFFKFEYKGGKLSLNVGGIDGVTNLDVLVKLYDASGKLVQTFDPTDSLSATVETTGRAVGTYYLSVEGTGLTLNGKTIYTDYGSLGQYMIVATVEYLIVAPSDLTLGTYNSTTELVSLSWKDNSTTETGFRVEYSTDGGQTWRLSETMKSNVTSRVATDVHTNSKYVFRVCALYGSERSDWTYSETLDTSAKTYAAPTDLTLGTYNSTTERVLLTWKDNSTTETGFRVEYSTDGGETWRLSEIMKPDVESRIATCVHTNSEYVFRVCALYGSERSDWTYSETLDASVKRYAAPTDLTFGTYDSTAERVLLTWKDNSTNETGFRVEYSTDGGQTWRLSETMKPDVTARVATCVHTNSKYVFRVCALYESEQSDWTYSETLDTSVK